MAGTSDQKINTGMPICFSSRSAVAFIIVIKTYRTVTFIFSLVTTPSGRYCIQYSSSMKHKQPGLIPNFRKVTPQYYCGAGAIWSQVYLAGAGADERRRKSVFIIAGAKGTESQTETDFGSGIEQTCSWSRQKTSLRKPQHLLSTAKRISNNFCVLHCNHKNNIFKQN